MFYIGGYYIQKIDFLKGCVDTILLALSLWGLLLVKYDTYYFHYSAYFFHIIIVSAIFYGLGGYDVPFKKGFNATIIKKLVVSLFITYGTITCLTLRYDLFDKTLWIILVLQHCILYFTFLIFKKESLQEKFFENILILSNQDDCKEIKKMLLHTNIEYHHVEYINQNHFDTETLQELCHKKDISLIILGHEKKLNHLPMLALHRFDNIRFLDVYLLQEQYLKKIDPKRLYSFHVLFDDFFSISILSIFLKRVFDILCSLIILFLTSPISIIVMLIIFFQDRHNVFYTQKRVGFKNKIFNCYKFRSMSIYAEKNGQAMWAQENDTRITPIGKFIRRTRIDEIPQCINVLKGDMSMIGPRPERPEFVSKLNDNIPYYNERHYIKPGITGWAQINASYGASIEDAKKKLEYDFYYLKHNNIFLDILILLKTISVIIWPNGVR